MTKGPARKFQWEEPSEATGDEYALRDTETDEVVLTSPDKSEVIKEAQRRNNYSPIDGDEDTYRQQVG